MHPDHAYGRGGANLSVGQGHYDKSGGHDQSESAGIGGYGNMHHTQHKHARKASIVDIVIGKYPSLLDNSDH